MDKSIVDKIIERFIDYPSENASQYYIGQFKDFDYTQPRKTWDPKYTAKNQIKENPERMLQVGCPATVMAVLTGKEPSAALKFLCELMPGNFLYTIQSKKPNSTGRKKVAEVLREKLENYEEL